MEYLLSNSTRYPKAIEAFKEEAKLESSEYSGKNLLEKKWVSVVRLQKRVMELEAKLLASGSNGVGLDPKFVAAGSHSGSAIDSGKLLPRAPCRTALTGHREPVTCIAMHPNYSLCASGSEDTTIRLWDFESGQYERTLKGHTGPVTGVAFDPNNGNVLASCSSDMTAKLWDMSSSGQYNCMKTLRGHDHSVSGVAFVLPTCDFVLTCSRDQSIKYWEVSTGYCNKTFAGHSDWVKCLSVSLDGEWVASGSSDQSIIVHKISSGSVVQTLRGHEHVVESVCFGKKPVLTMVSEAIASSAAASASGSALSAAEMQEDAHPYSYLVSGSRDKTVRLWDVLRGECLSVFTVHVNWVRAVAFHSSGKYIISCSDDRSIKVCDIKEGRCVRSLDDAHGHFVTCLAVPPAPTSASGVSASSSAYRIILSGSVDKSVHVWGCS